MKEPDFASPAFDAAVEAKIDEVVGRHALRVLHWIIVGIIGCSVSVIGAAVWATKVYGNIDRLIATVEEQQHATDKRIFEWTTWRLDVDAHFRAIDGRTGDRWTRSSARDFAAELGYMNPALKVPSVDDIAKRQVP